MSGPGKINVGRRLAVGDLRMSVWTSDAKITQSAAEVDVTTDESLDSTGLSKSFAPGLVEAMCELSSVMSDFEGSRLALLGRSPVLLTYALGSAAGRVAYLGLVRLFSESQNAKLGEAFKSTDMFRFTEMPVAGTLLHCGPIAATGNSTALQLGAIPSDEVLVVGVHVTNPPGVTGTTPQLGVQLKSATSTAFTGTIANRGAAAVFEDVGWLQFVIPGPVTDPAWRFAFTVSGTDTPSFFLMAAGGRRRKE